MAFNQSSLFKTDMLVQNCLHARQEWILSLHYLCRLRPFTQTQRSTLLEAIQMFCDHLVDYTAWWHFGFFEKMSEIIEQEKHPVRDAYHQMLLILIKSTQAILDFNDKYQANDNLTTFDKDLSRLAEWMAQRLEWEDKALLASRLLVC